MRPKVAKPRLPQAASGLARLFKSTSGVKKPTIKKLWLVSLLLWLLCLSAVVAVLFWRDPSWLVQYRALAVGVSLVSLLAAIVLPMFWRLFVVWDGQELRVGADSQRSAYQRQTLTQKNLLAFAAHLAEQHPLGGGKHQCIMAISGDASAFADVGEQLTRVGWAKTDEVYWVLVNELAEIDAFPRWRGVHQAPFDGLLLLSDLGSPEALAAQSSWLAEFYQRLNWSIPYVCVLRSEQALLNLDSHPVFDWAQTGQPVGADLGDKVYDYCALGFLNSRDPAFLRLHLAHHNHPADLAMTLPPGQLSWCQGVAVQAQQANWWRHYVTVAKRLSQVRPHMLQRPFKLVLYRALGGCLVVLGAAVLLSFGLNLKQAQNVSHLIEASTQAQGHDDALTRLLALQEQVAVLGREPQPLYMRLGFNHRQALHDYAIEVYAKGVQATLLAPIDAQIKVVLQSLSVTNLDGSEASLVAVRAGQTSDIALVEGFDALKAYLMLRQPERVEPIFLSDYLWPLSQQLSPANQAESAQVLAFYSRYLPEYPHWALAMEHDLVAQSRQQLSQLVGAQAQDVALYEEMMAVAKARYSDLSLSQLVGPASAEFWRTDAVVPGALTRAAWDGHIRQAIEQINPEHHMNGSWVLTDGVAIGQAAETDIRRQIMRLYQADYVAAWQTFLNSLRWTPAKGLNSQTERIKKYADRQQSVLFQLLQQLRTQAQVGFEEDRDAEGKGVLFAFKPLTDLLSPIEVDKNITTTALGGYQEKLLVLYLEMQKIQGSSNREAASQNMFNVLVSQQNSPNALSEVEQEIALQVASLGELWQEAGKTLLDVPFLASKNMILAPAIQNINTQWQAQVVAPWQQRFGQQYPFVATATTDVSLAALGQFVDPERGLVAQFVRQYLGNTLLLVGNQWQPNPEVTDQLQFDPEFIGQLNRLTQTMAFLQPNVAKAPLEIMFVPTAGLQKITLSVDGQSKAYFNEQSFWQKIPFQNDEQAERASALQWLDHDGGVGRLAFLGDLGFLRLLDQARVAVEADGSLRLSWVVQGQQISLKVKNNQDHGFMGLLRLKNQVLPATIFEETAHGN